LEYGERTGACATALEANKYCYSIKSTGHLLNMNLLLHLLSVGGHKNLTARLKRKKKKGIASLFRVILSAAAAGSWLSPEALQ